MQAQDFAQFVASQQTRTGAGVESVREDRTEILGNWLKDLDHLCRQILGFLDEFVKAGSIRYDFSEITLTEEDLGSYPVKRMDISIGRQQVFIEPVGALLIGYRGRVDVVGALGRAQLVLVDGEAQSVADLIKVKVGPKGSAFPLSDAVKRGISWTWKIVSREPRGRFVELDQEAFSALLMEIVGA